MSLRGACCLTLSHRSAAILAPRCPPGFASFPHVTKSTDLILRKRKRMANLSKLHGVNLTDAFVRSADSEGKERLEISDMKTPGLVLRITKSGKKTFILRARGPNQEKLYRTIGAYPIISLKVARSTATRWHGLVKRGIDPTADMKKSKAASELQTMTLENLIAEAKIELAISRAIWRENNRPGRVVAEAEASIRNVFAQLLQMPLSRITTQIISDTVRNYTPVRPVKGKNTANGAAARALAYLSTVYNWGAARGTYKKQGAGRNPALRLPDLSEVQDPSAFDDTIEGKRERVLSRKEFEAVLPLLTYPAPKKLAKLLDPEDNYGPAAFQFIALTMSRLNNVLSLRKKDVDIEAKTWTAYVKSTPARGKPSKRRKVVLPLSDAAVDLLLSLPSFLNGEPDDLVFPSSTGGRLMNIDRVQTAINEASSTSGWHRHDLRRSCGTIMDNIGIEKSVTDKLLCHANRLAREDVSQSAAHYLIDVKIVDHAPDRAREAVNLLAAVLRSFEGQQARDEGSLVREHIREEIGQLPIQRQAPSPWAV